MKALKTPLFLLSLALLCSCRSSKTAGTGSAAQAAPPDSAPPAYVLGPADQIAITVWRNSDLNRTTIVDPSGDISMPLSGQIRAAGLTIPELEQKIAASLAGYVNDPQVDVALTGAKSSRVHVLGEVRTPGSYTMDHAMKPLDAVAGAGGFLTSANQGKVLLVRRDKERLAVTNLNLNLKSSSGRQAMARDEYLRNGDILCVLPTKTASIESYMSRIKNIVSPIVTVEQGIVLWPQVMDAIRGEESGTTTPIAVTP